MSCEVTDPGGTRHPTGSMNSELMLAVVHQATRAPPADHTTNYFVIHSMHQSLAVYPEQTSSSTFSSSIASSKDPLGTTERRQEQHLGRIQWCIEWWDKPLLVSMDEDTVSNLSVVGEPYTSWSTGSDRLMGACSCRSACVDGTLLDINPREDFGVNC